MLRNAHKGFYGVHAHQNLKTEYKMKPEIKAFFDHPTNTISYVVADPETKSCAVIDSLLDFDQASGRTKTDSADKMIAYVREQGLTCEWIIDTHVHADHLTAAPYIKSKLGGKTAIGDKISVVQKVFGEIFNEGQTFHTDGSQFDHLFKDGETYKVGNIEGRAIHTPGHTPACMSHLIGDALFVGDTIFMPDFGSVLRLLVVRSEHAGSVVWRTAESRIE